MPEIYDQNQPLGFAVVPDLVFKGIINDDELSFLPGSIQDKKKTKSVHVPDQVATGTWNMEFLTCADFKSYSTGIVYFQTDHFKPIVVAVIWLKYC